MTGQAEREKTSAARSSVLAAIGLTTIKIVVGILTGSLGILAEAAHSGLDLVAALVTWFAVRASGKPADKDHHFGHGKIENLSALFETFLLLVTCIWIISESIQRLFIHPVEVDASIWAFLVMAVSIVIDATRSKILYAAARKHNSQALEADALHFSTDIWSSSVVIGGLLLVKVAEWTGIKWLHQADAVAALGVAVIVIYVSVQLGARTIKGLLDTAPDGLAEKVESAAESIPGVRDCHAVRVRSSGPDLFIDVHIVVDAGMDVAAAHAITEQVEAAVRQVAGNADVTVHVEPQEH